MNDDANSSPAEASAPSARLPLGRWTWPALAAVIVAAGFSYKWVDLPLTQMMRQLPKWLRDFLRTVTEAGEAGWVLLVLAIILLGAIILRRKRWTAWTALALFANALIGITVVLLRIGFGRARPAAYTNPKYHAWGFDPFTFGYHFNSFPSGHSATAGTVGMAILILKPWGWRVWVGLSVFVALTRVGVTAHYLSDVLIGYAFGATMTALIFRWARGRGLWWHEDEPAVELVSLRGGWHKVWDDFANQAWPAIVVTSVTIWRALVASVRWSKRALAYAYRLEDLPAKENAADAEPGEGEPTASTSATDASAPKKPEDGDEAPSPADAPHPPSS